MDAKTGAVRNRFKAPEGRYELVSERATGLVAFHNARCTRLTLAILAFNTHEDGSYVIFNVGDMLHVMRLDTASKEPLRSVALAGTGVRSVPTCHAHIQQPNKDSADTLVGIGDGAVHLLSLRAQLTSTSGKPNIAATLTPEAGPDARCVAVAWLPKTDGMFAAAFGSGNIYVYKRGAILGEGSRFSLSLSSNSKSTNAHTLAVSGRGITDMAPSPCGSRLAVACVDGVLRVVDVATGSVVCGFQSYYGSLLCCSYSPDGRYVAAGGEDDLVCVYSVHERYAVAHCQGHNSWVSRVQWDPWMQLGGTGGPPSGGGAPSNGATPGGALPTPDAGRVYRLASAGQDASLCLWDVQPLDGEVFGMTPSTTGLTNGTSTSLAIRKSNSALNLHGSPTRGASGEISGTTHPGHSRKPSMSKMSGTGTITLAPPFADMNLVQPSMQHRIHQEPMSDVLFTDSFILTADHSGCIRTWKRPSLLQRLSLQRAALFSAAAGLGDGQQHMTPEFGLPRY